MILSVIYLGCKKSEDSPAEIYGTWRLTETMQDPGDGSGKYEKVKGDLEYLTLERSGQISGDAIPGLESFKVLDSARVEVSSKDYSKPIVYYYKVSADSLTLNPPCFEGCGFRFVRE